jgi:hypothetical protein
MYANSAWNDGSPTPLNQVINGFADWCRGRPGFWTKEDTKDKLLPPVIKIVIPATLAVDVLNILRNERITLAHLMPNYGGVVSSINLKRELAE